MQPHESPALAEQQQTTVELIESMNSEEEAHSQEVGSKHGCPLSNTKPSTINQQTKTKERYHLCQYIFVEHKDGLLV